MSVVFQYAGRLRHQHAQEIGAAFHDFLPALHGQAGFESAKLLVSYATLQAQMLFQFADYDAATRFHREIYGLLARRLTAIMEREATAVASVLEAAL